MESTEAHVDHSGDKVSESAAKNDATCLPDGRLTLLPTNTGSRGSENEARSCGKASL